MTFKAKFLIFSTLVVLSFFQMNVEKTSAQRTPARHESNDVKVCADMPLQLNLSEELLVDSSNGHPEVIVNWALIEGKDPHIDKKVDLFMSFLDEDPLMGDSDQNVRNLFTNYIYKTLSNSKNNEVKRTLQETLAQTLQESKALSHRNIEDLFHDYYPYLFISELKNNILLSQAFTQGLVPVLKNEEIKLQDLLNSLAHNLKNIPAKSEAGRTATCMANALKGFESSIFVPGQKNTIYGLQDVKMQKLIQQIKKDEKIKAITTSILHDSSLIAASQSALEKGASGLLEEWHSNQNVQNLVNFYEMDPSMKQVVDTFFASPIGKKIDQCVRSEFGENLLPRIQDTYLSLLESELNSENTCSNETSEVMMIAIKKLLSLNQKPEIREELNKAVMSFANNYLSIEKNISDATKKDAPFNDFYTNAMSTVFDYSQRMSIELYRDNELIYVENNPNVTQFVDRNLPENDSGKIKYHQYHIVSRTSCDAVVSTIGRATLEPVLKSGTPVDAKLNLSIKLKENRSQSFMDRLQVLFKGLSEEKIELKISPKENSMNSVHCIAARKKLLENKSSGELVEYVLSCFGDDQVNETMKKQVKDIINPLIRFLDLNKFADIDKITAEFLAPIIQRAREEYELKTQVISKLIPLAEHAKTLSKIKTLDEFTDNQKKLIKCGGYPECPQNIQNLVANYLEGAAHAAEVMVEVKDEDGRIVITKNGNTDIFGVLEGLTLTTLQIGQNYQFKIKLLNEPYALPKAIPVKIIAATPQDGGRYQAIIDLSSQTPFFYGNFDNSNEEIDLNDIQAWAKLIESDPKKWASSNVDGFMEIDLFDVTLLQSNWGNSEKTANKNWNMTLSEMADIFGYQTNDGKVIYTPPWIKERVKSCN